MTYYGAKELAEAFRTVRKNTLIIAEEIPEDKYEFQASPESRSVAHTLAHLAISPRWQYEVAKLTDMTKFDFPAYFMAAGADEKKHRSKAELIELLGSEGERFAVFLEGLSEEFLGEVLVSPFGSKSRFEMLLGAKEHEMHHRGQLMIIERMIGLVPHLTRAQQERIAATMKARAAS